MSVSPIAKKLQLKPGHRILLVKAPENFLRLLDPLPEGIQLCFEASETFDVVQVFVMNRTELKVQLEWLQPHLRPDSILWIAYPKKSSGISSDLDMMMSWEETSAYGLSPVASAAINETWTALRFRPTAQIKRSVLGNSEIQKNELGKYIDVKNRIVSLPPELRSELELKPQAITFFESLSYSNKKEYVSWVMSAKQEKTRAERIQKTAEKLMTGRKNPAQK